MDADVFERRPPFALKSEALDRQKVVSFLFLFLSTATLENTHPLTLLSVPELATLVLAPSPPFSNVDFLSPSPGSSPTA